MKIETQTKLDLAPTEGEVTKTEKGHGKCLMSRRDFLFASGVSTVAMVSAGPGMAKVPAMVTTYPRKLVAKLSQLMTDRPIDFSYAASGA